MKTAHSLLLGLVVCGLATACTTKHLVFVTYTKVGVDIGVADSVPNQLTFGYKRFEGAIVPVDPCVSKNEKAKDDCAEANEEQPEAMSVYAGMDLENSWVNGLTITQLFATGDAAINAANDPNGFAGLVEAAGRSEAKEEEEKP
jgi:hypothetical protein